MWSYDQEDSPDQDGLCLHGQHCRGNAGRSTVSLSVTLSFRICHSVFVWLCVTLSLRACLSLCPMHVTSWCPSVSVSLSLFCWRKFVNHFFLSVCYSLLAWLLVTLSCGVCLLVTLSCGVCLLVTLSFGVNLMVTLSCGVNLMVTLSCAVNLLVILS